MVGISWLSELLYNDAAFAVCSIQHCVLNLLGNVSSRDDGETVFLIEIKFETLLCLRFSQYL